MGLVDNLLNLYRVDAQVRGLRSRLQSAERYLNAQTKQLNDLHQQQQELTTRRKQVQATIATIEVEIKSIDDRLEKLRGELNSAATNKQYTALLTELNTVKESRSKAEDRMLGDMEQLESIQKQLTDLEPQVAERNKVRDVAQAQLNERRNDVGQRLSELEAEREKAAAVVPPDALTIFEQIADHYDGESMAPIEQVGRREFACGACNIGIPLQMSLAALQSDSFVRCPSCGRILYMQDEMRGALAGKK